MCAKINQRQQICLSITSGRLKWPVAIFVTHVAKFHTDPVAYCWGHWAWAMDSGKCSFKLQNLHNFFQFKWGFWGFFRFLGHLLRDDLMHPAKNVRPYIRTSVRTSVHTYVCTYVHSRQYDFQGHPRSGSRSGDDLRPLLGLFFFKKHL